jgi:DNA repair protein RadC
MLGGVDGARKSVKRTLLGALPIKEQPAWRVMYNATGCSVVELVAAVVGGERQLEIAHALVGKYKSLPGLARANCAELSTLVGIGERTAARLHASLELGRRLTGSIEEPNCLIQSPEDMAAYLIPRMQDLEQEQLVVVLLNTRNRIMGEPITVYQGSLNASMVRIAEILRPAVRVNAAAIIVAHNHPSADPTPSPEDVTVTQAIFRSGKMLDIDVLDHLIIGRNRFTSMKAKGLGFD